MSVDSNTVVEREAETAPDLTPEQVLIRAVYGNGFRQEIVSLTEGPAMLRWPAVISHDSYEDMVVWLHLVLRKTARAAGVEYKP